LDTRRRIRLIGSRVLQIAPVVVLATFVVFGLMHLVPGDPAVTLAGDYATAQRIEEIRHAYGFDRPLLVQYWSWLSGALQFDLGKSLQSSELVSSMIAHRFPNTLIVVVMALLLSMAIGVPFGILAATRSGGRLVRRSPRSAR